MRKKLQRALTRTKEKTSELARRDQPSEAVPRITTETIASHREEVLKGARKYIYPLQHSKHRIVLISSGIFLALILSFLVFVTLSLYRFQSTSTFMYRITQVIPLPIARQGRNFVAYENYLFELRHYMHYYERQQKLSFESESGVLQLASYKQRALDKVIDDSLIKKAAAERGIEVTDAELDAQIELARQQNRLGSSDQVFEDVLKEYWGWTVRDYRRSLRTEMLSQELAVAVDQESAVAAADIKARLASGADFAALAAEISADTNTKAQGGELGVVEKSDRSLSPQTIDALFKLQTGQVSEPVVVPYGTGFAYEIIKNLETQGDKIRAAHIIIPIKDIGEFLNDRKEQNPVRQYIHLKSPEES